VYYINYLFVISLYIMHACLASKLIHIVQQQTLHVEINSFWCYKQSRYFYAVDRFDLKIFVVYKSCMHCFLFYRIFIKACVYVFAEAVWPSGRASVSELESHEFKSGRRQLSVILFRCTGRTLTYHLCSPHMPRT